MVGPVIRRKTESRESAAAEANGARLKRHMDCGAVMPDLGRLATTADALADPFTLKQRLAAETRSGFRLGVLL